MFSLESPPGDSNENTQYTFFRYKEENHPICSHGMFSKGLKNEFETTVVNEQSVFEPLKVYSIFHFDWVSQPDHLLTLEYVGYFLTCLFSQ